ncbi:DUF1273 domain-containing protein [Bacillus taeanensis]|uniref:UPF0398 protein DS031_11075 n=1 Tax=Bacillus taeanensis TaxID=273032 RepID=A0A366XXF3_9BACI|nr:DUF1273 domain-containing protein [Bacillus taeanensis]RBW69459.1 hypothetical protein DS031_11075 [Bacillus taeanensis]
MGKVLTVTGYKSHELGIFNDKHPGLPYIKKALKRNLERLIDEFDLEWVLISGQLGVELWTAEIVFELQETYPHLKLAVLTPFLGQEERWNEERQEYYEMITAQADFYESISKKPYESPLQLKVKNQFLIEKSSGLLILYDEEQPGSPKYYLEEALKKRQSHPNFEIFTITPFDINELIQDEQNSW